MTDTADRAMQRARLAGRLIAGALAENDLVSTDRAQVHADNFASLILEATGLTELMEALRLAEITMYRATFVCGTLIKKDLELAIDKVRAALTDKEHTTND